MQNLLRHATTKSIATLENLRIVIVVITYQIKLYFFLTFIFHKKIFKSLKIDPIPS